ERERRNRAARVGRDGGAQPARARRLHVAALRRTNDRRNQPHARPRHERGETQRVPRGPQAPGRARAAAERAPVKHYSDDDLTLYYYGEARRPADIEQHLDHCAACAATYRAISATLSLVAEPPVPERGDLYGLEVWQRIRQQLPAQESSWRAGWF